jgi:hypothetical protein
MTNSRLAFHLDSGGGGWTESTNEGPTPTRTVAGPCTLTFLAGLAIDSQKFSIIQTLLPIVVPAMASSRPLGAAIT